MNDKLLELPANTLLDKIGAGNHIPGSGSAAALNGILACKLILTVIELTIDPKRKSRYIDILHKCTFVQDNIKDRIAPKLEVLFQKDSEYFDQTIKKREERDKEKNQKNKNSLAEQSNEALKVSTQLPVEIANLCLELAEYAIFIFDECFKSARGDSSVALGSALSGISGSIAIISLNLRSFAKSNWTEEIKEKRNLLKEKLELLTKENFNRIETLDAEAEEQNEYKAVLDEVRGRLYGRLDISHNDLDNIVRDLHLLLWEYKHLIWQKNTPRTPLEVVNSEKVIKLLKYELIKNGAIGTSASGEEIGGVIDNRIDRIVISSDYPLDVINFTTAHELGHALLHDQLVLHRDKPISEPNERAERPLEEKQADKFAALFLMPDKLVRTMVVKLFGVSQLEFNQEIVSSLNGQSIINFSKKINKRRAFSRLIAKTTMYNYKPFTPLHKIFKVSVEAMAIRLEELNLVKY